MYDNKLVYPIGFDIERSAKQLQEDFKNIEKLAIDMEKAIKEGVSDKNINIQSFQRELRKLSIAMDNITKSSHVANKAQADQAVQMGKAEKAVIGVKRSHELYKRSLMQTERSALALARAQEKANKKFSFTGKLVDQLIVKMGAYLSVYALQRFFKNMRDITAEFELQRVALGAILQDKAMADELFDKIVDQALKSPFGIREILTNTKQLAAYRIEAEKLYDIQTRLSDVAAGLGTDMSRLALAYGQVHAAGVLRSRELRRFTEVGIPMLDLLAKKFTELRGNVVSTAEVFQLIQKRAVPFSMVEQIFKDMTDAGGIFYEMQITQANTLFGVWKNLRDAYDKMYNEIGTQNRGLLVGVGNVLKAVAANWKIVYNVATGATVVYLAHAAATFLLSKSIKQLTVEQWKSILASGVEVKAMWSKIIGMNAATIATRIYTRAMEGAILGATGLSRALWRLIAAFIASGWGAVVAALAALGTGMYFLLTRTRQSEKAVESMAATMGQLKTVTEDVAKLIDEYEELDGVLLKNESQMEKQAGVIQKLAEAYPAAVTEVNEYGEAVSISMEKVKELREEEEKLLRVQAEKEIKGAKKEIHRHERELKRIQEQIAMGGKRRTDSYGNYYIDKYSPEEMAKFREEEAKRLAKINELVAKINSHEKGLLGVFTDGGEEAVEKLDAVRQALFDLKSEFKFPITGEAMKLYDNKEDLLNLSTSTALAKNLKDQLDAAVNEYEVVNEMIISLQGELRMAEAVGRDVYDIQRKIDFLLGERDAALAKRQLVEEGQRISGLWKALESEKERINIIREEVALIKEARSSYLEYSRMMTEIDAMKQLRSQTRYAGITVDVSDADEYVNYLRTMLDRIMKDPAIREKDSALVKIREDIEKELAALDWKKVSDEIKKKLDAMGKDIEAHQVANQFFEKLLGITGDLELSTALTIEYTGLQVSEIGNVTRKHIQDILRYALESETIDISEMGLNEIKLLIESIPDNIKDVKTSAESLFQTLEKGAQDSVVKLYSLYREIEKLELQDEMLAGTGVAFDISKALRDMIIKEGELKRERVMIEAEVAALREKNGDKWYNQQMAAIARVYNTLSKNEHTATQDKINGIAKVVFEEQKRLLGLDMLLKDMGDKTLGQVQEALNRIDKMKDVEILKVSDSTVITLRNMGIEIDNLRSKNLKEIFDELGDSIPEADKQLLEIIQTMQLMGITTEEAAKEYLRLVEALKEDTETERVKKDMKVRNELMDGLLNIMSDIVTETDSADSSFGKFAETIKKAGSSYKNLEDTFTSLLEKMNQASASKGGEGAAGNIMSKLFGSSTASAGQISAAASTAASVIGIFVGMLYLMSTQMTRANTEAINIIDKQTDSIKRMFESILSMSGSSSILVDDQIAKYQKLNETVRGFAADLSGDWDIYYKNMSQMAKLTEYIFEARSKLSREIYEYLSKVNLQDIDGIERALREIDAALEKARKRTDIAILNQLKEQLEGMKSSLVEMDNIVKNIVGDMTNAIREAMTGLARGSADVLSEFAKSLSESLENIIESRVFAQIMGDTFAAFEANIKNAMGSGDLDAITKAYSDLFEAMLNNQAKYAKQLEIARRVAAEYGIILFDSFDESATAAERLYNNIKDIDSAIQHLKEQGQSVDIGLLQQLKEQAAIMEDEFQRLWQEYKHLLTQEPEYGDPERQTWEWDKKYYEQYFPDGVFGDMTKGLTDYQKEYKNIIDMIAELEARLESTAAIALLEKQKQSILDEMYKSGYDKYATDEMKHQDALKEFLDDIKMYNRLAAEATDPEQQQRWAELARLAQEAFNSAVADDFNSKLDDMLSEFDNNIEAVAYLKEMLSTLTDATQIEEVEKRMAALNDDIYKDLYGQYADDATKYNDELELIRLQLQWAIENGYPELAKWIEEAYDRTVLEHFMDGLEEIASDMDDEIDKYKYYHEELAKATVMLMQSILAANEDDIAYWTAIIEAVEEMLGGLEKSIRDNLWSQYATDAQRYEKELAAMNKDLEWALQHYPELAEQIADAFNTSVLENWRKEWEKMYDDAEDFLAQYELIEQALADIVIPTMSYDEALAGRDKQLKRMAGLEEGTPEYEAAKELYDLYMQQIDAHLIINELLEERLVIDKKLYEEFASESMRLTDDIDELERKIEAMQGRAKDATDPSEIAKWNALIAQAEKELAELKQQLATLPFSEEIEKMFEKIKGVGIREGKAMLAAFREQIEEELADNPELLALVLALLDEIYGDIEERTGKVFNDIEKSIRSVAKLLGDMKVDQEFIDSLNSIADIFGSIFTLTLGISDGDWAQSITGATGLIGGLINLARTLVTYSIEDPFAGMKDIGDAISEAERTVRRAVGIGIAPAQQGLIDVYAHSKREIEAMIAKEEKKPTGFFARLFGFAKDEDAIEEAKKRIKEYEDLIEQVQEDMKLDFLQTDYVSFADSLADILIRPWDSYMEMMDSVRVLTEQTIDNIVRHALALHIQARVKDALDALYSGGLSGASAGGGGITDANIAQFEQNVKDIVTDSQTIMEHLGQFFSDIPGATTAYDTISRITEAQANSFLGYYQNFLIIMTDMNNVLKYIWGKVDKLDLSFGLENHLIALNTIAYNTGATMNNTSRIGEIADDMKAVKTALSKSGAY